MTWPPAKPRNFPLTITTRGYVKRINGVIRWIAGKVDPEVALKKYHAIAAARAGRRIIPLQESPRGSPTVEWVLERWLEHKLGEHDRGALARAASYLQYKRSADYVDNLIGQYRLEQIGPDGIVSLFNELAADKGAARAKRAVGHFIHAASYAQEMGWCDALRFGSRILRRLKVPGDSRGSARLYTPAQLRSLLALCRRWQLESGPANARVWQQVHCMILLALNGGLGATECSELARDVVDLGSARLDFTRGKTGVQHLVPMWDATARAIGDVLDLRLHGTRVFSTRAGEPWVRHITTAKSGIVTDTYALDNVADRFNDLADELGLKFPGQSFYRLKHWHCTRADAAGDPHATFPLAGHALPGSKDHYVRVAESRIRAVVDRIHDDLIAGATDAELQVAGLDRRPASDR